MTIVHGAVALATNLVAAWWQPLLIAGGLGLAVRWAYKRACTWADQTLADVPWIVERPAWIVEIAPDSDEMWAEFEEEQFWAHIQKATDSLHKRGQRRPGSES